jgi:anthranilate phosphoribosyltransferase
VAFDGEHGPVRDIVVLNAGASLFIAGAAPDVAAGMAMASAALDEGRASAVLQRLVEQSNLPGETPA